MSFEVSNTLETIVLQSSALVTVRIVAATLVMTVSLSNQNNISAISAKSLTTEAREMSGQEVG